MASEPGRQRVRQVKQLAPCRDHAAGEFLGPPKRIPNVFVSGVQAADKRTNGDTADDIDLQQTSAEQ